MMKTADACIYPYPAGDTSLRRFASELELRGFTGAVAVGLPAGCTVGNVRFLSGAEITANTVKSCRDALRNAREVDIVMVHAGDAAFNRAVLGNIQFHILRGIYHADKRAFDHVSARMAADRGVAVDIDLSRIISESGNRRQRALERYRDIGRFSRKYGFMLTLSSGGRSITGVRSVRAFSLLGELAGLEKEQVRRALATPEALLSPQRSVEVIE
ncbi:RNase P subunit p30 family protein [Methanogenium organophilum]|uniref:Ribonuclease P protein component 3 n=1 Tax=Methanogenium organophilum TaxID=2199 RepID=A0A9X9S4Q2_METOG|nr:RNase P subunit p30 family protein [Methanogenium organophilum]WAI01636.1 ribonuclease P [Methanogenium organophilum]